MSHHDVTNVFLSCHRDGRQPKKMVHSLFINSDLTDGNRNATLLGSMYLNLALNAYWCVEDVLQKKYKLPFWVGDKFVLIHLVYPTGIACTQYYLFDDG